MQMQKIKSVRRLKAFTIAELIVGVMLTSIIAGAITLAMGTSFSVYKTTRARNDLSMTAKGILNDISRTIQVAKSVSVEENSNSVTLTISLFAPGEDAQYENPDPEEQTADEEETAYPGDDIIYRFTSGRLDYQRISYDPDNDNSTDGFVTLIDSTDMTKIVGFEADVVNYNSDDAPTEYFVDKPRIVRVRVKLQNRDDQNRTITLSMSAVPRRNL